MSSQEARNGLAARRSRRRRQGIAVLESGQEVAWRDLLAHVAVMRDQADAYELEAVTVARVSGCSWDRISAALGGRITGEGLRLRYGRLVAERSQAVVDRVRPRRRVPLP